MRAGGDRAGMSHDDAWLSRLYQQITDLQAPRFGADYDLEKGLERYQAWLAEHTGDADPTEPVRPVGSGAPEGDGAVTATLADTTAPDAFLVSGTAREEWSADLAVVAQHQAVQSAVPVGRRPRLFGVLERDDVRLGAVAGDVADEVLEAVTERDAEPLGDRRQVHLLLQAARAGDDFDSHGHDVTSS